MLGTCIVRFDMMMKIFFLFLSEGLTPLVELISTDAKAWLLSLN